MMQVDLSCLVSTIRWYHEMENGTEILIKVRKNIYFPENKAQMGSMLQCFNFQHIVFNKLFPFKHLTFQRSL